MKSFWKDKKVLVTGGSGFIGSHVVEKLVGRGANVRILDRISDGKLKYIEYLKDNFEIIRGECTDPDIALNACTSMDVVMNLAAHVGGIEYNRTHQATMLHDNMVIATSMIEAARKAQVERFLVVSSACVYPHDAIVPTPESEGTRGEPEPTNSGYGWAKRYAELLGKLYSEEYGMKVGIVRPYNAYGPRDHFSPESSHVIPALIARVMNEENPVIVWGSGKQTRAFLYVEDFADGLIQAIEKYPVPDPINIGTDEEISIGDLVKMIIKISGKNTQVQFDTTKPDGSPKRNSDNTKAKEKIGFTAKISLKEGLQKTIEWYIKNHI
ncbi:NAD-dependent epimerase/dehydratase family protein [Patescibacteria group bacterium]|nr:NAD-dependent epimerase/dehydratase family protein [Patescibacteria group bacterium]MBU1472778.1 NAD-dependent epimerase/dehydratase family protein [Patescibacteria group bacterium]MBU2460044.1 NAD-dependent epimerase/dehydratase family protein [Patescibacteria group bacterium]MBU2544298.1 NAD-dependent epimerase/dehydratase family protein [Patescibacteria group bacterium]